VENKGKYRSTKEVVKHENIGYFADRLENDKVVEVMHGYPDPGASHD